MNRLGDWILDNLAFVTFVNVVLQGSLLALSLARGWATCPILAVMTVVALVQYCYAMARP